uniref:Uncharacterized protein n=1 Tax=Avena sativa TaxID=4498 RepID=A0ACD5TSE5_AVESA
MAVVLISKSPSVLVKPSSDPATSAAITDYLSLIGLTSYDEPNVGRPVTAFLVFDRPIDDPAETIRQGLSLALVPYYPISGRLATAFLACDVLTAIDCTGDGAGVPFVAASADAALRDVDLRGHLEELAVFYPAAGDPLLRPLLMVQVTVFSCGGFVIGVTWDHSIADGAGMGQFLRAIGELARGMPSPAVVPCRHDLSLAGMPSAFVRVNRLVNSLQPSLLTLLHLAVPYSLVSRIRQQFAAAVNGGHPCTAFEAVAAVLWRCRTRAVMSESDPSAPALLGFVADTRTHAGARDGYYGNCCYIMPPVGATSGAVAGGDVVDLIWMIRRAKERIPDYYNSSMDEEDEDGRRLQELADAGLLGYGNMLGVSCWRNLGMDKVDFGGGTPARVMGYMKEGMGRLPCCVCLPCEDGGDSFSVTSLCVKEEHAGAFLRELASLA